MIFQLLCHMFFLLIKFSADFPHTPFVSLSAILAKYFYNFLTPMCVFLHKVNFTNYFTYFLFFQFFNEFLIVTVLALFYFSFL